MNSNNPQSKTFETFFSILLLAPVLFFFFGSLFGSSLGYLFSLIASLCLPILLSGCNFSKSSLREFLPRSELESLAFFILSFSICLYLCLLWPDFIAIGERLRDYSLLASVKDFPLQAKEPWMTGANLNYYLYWYRFAAYWSTILGLEVWQTYHLLSAFSFSFFISCLFRLSRSYFNVSLGNSLIFSLLTAFGSNLDGIISAFSGSTDWWGPSRVIKGTINEFASWSFILGDLHPHFLNLALTPFILCLAFAIFKMSLSLSSRCLLILILFTVSAPFYYNANAWEVPLAGITFGLIVLLLGLINLSFIFSNFKYSLSSIKQDLNNKKFISLLITFIVCLISMFMSSKNIQPADYPWRLVREPVAVSNWSELLKHWAIPLLLMTIVIIKKIGTLGIYSQLILFILAASIGLAKPAVTFIILAIFFTSLAVEKIKSYENLNFQAMYAVLYCLGISSLILIALGELVYLDDPYGGENERMNTVFKIYSACWAPVHLFAFIVFYLEFPQQKARTLLCLALVACMPAFFTSTIKLRKNLNPGIEGLASVEQELNGSGDLIRFLRTIPRNVVLEAQGNPYSYTSFVSTLGGHDSYLGWANHVGLLTGNHEEVARREKVTTEIYNLTDCESKKELAKKEGIQLIVVGLLEKQKYTPAGLQSFNCMPAKYTGINFNIFSPG